MKNKVLKVAALFFALFVMVQLALPAPVYARDLKEVQQEIENAKKQLNEIEKKIEANKSNKAAAEAALLDYQAQYDAMLLLIDEQENLIYSTMETLDRKTEQLSDTLAGLYANREQFGQRLKAIYEINRTNAAMAALLSVDSFSEFIKATDGIKRISERDTQLLQDLEAKKVEFENQRLELESFINDLHDELNILQENRDWLNTKMEEMKATIANANYSIQLNEQEKKETEEEVKALQEEYARIFRELQQKGSQYGDNSVRHEGPLSWPTGGSKRVSSWFGDPRSNTRGHYGIDIPDPTGTPILAAASGTVITAEWHYSYGYYMVLDHGQGFRTLYAHCSQLYYTAGNYVTTGTTIAAMGNTGNSYGSHLHFEVHEFGVRQDPAGPNYLGIY